VDKTQRLTRAHASPGVSAGTDCMKVMEQTSRVTKRREEGWCVTLCLSNSRRGSTSNGLFGQCKAYVVRLYIGHIEITGMQVSESKKTFNSLITQYQKSITDSFQKEEHNQKESCHVLFFSLLSSLPTKSGKEKGMTSPKNRNNGIISRKLWLSTTLNQHPPGYLGNAFSVR